MQFSLGLKVGFALGCAALTLPSTAARAETFRIQLGAGVPQQSYDGRVILVLTADGETEPRFQVRADFDAPQILGVYVDGLTKGQHVLIDKSVLGFPSENLGQVPAGDYYVQAVLHKYDTFKLANGKVVKLPAARGAGQNWSKEPGNLYSKPVKVHFDPKSDGAIGMVLDQLMPPIAELQDTEFVRHIKVKSELLSKFWGRDVFIRGHVLLPRDFTKHPEARFPLMILHQHFPEDFGNFRTTPPDKDLKCVPSTRFNLPCYNRTEQEEAYAFYKKWISADFPRFLAVEIDHSNPYYDDSYAVNSANIGPYGDAIEHEFIPALEKQFQGLGKGWARFLYGGSTGGWEALATLIHYPDDYNGAFVACPDSVDFRQFELINIYDDDNVYWRQGPFGRVAKPGFRNYLGQISYTVEMENRKELVLGDKGRSGGDWDAWTAVYSPMGADGYPKPIWDKRTGIIDKQVAAYWRENYDLRYIMERDWKTLGPKLQGKIHIYVGDMDNYYLNNAVYLAEDFLKKADPPAKAEIDYGDRAEHCWNGDHTVPNAVSRLHYNSQFVPKILKRISETAPEGADLTSWRYE